MLLSEANKEKFWRCVQKSGEDECWNYVSPRGGKSDDYGFFCPKGFRPGILIRPHRYALMLKLGRKLEEGECSLHKCDNPRCCNPNHLFLGTQTDNIRDMCQKGRQSSSCGENKNTAKLTEADVLRIRRLWDAGDLNCREEAEKHGMDRTSIWSIAKRHCWKHIPEETS